VTADADKLIAELRDSYNARDPERWVALCTQDCEWHPFLTARVEGDPGYHGHNGMRAWFEDVDEMFSQTHADIDDVREVGGRILALGHMKATGRGSGAEVSSEAAWLVELKGDQLKRGWAYNSRQEAESEAEALAPSDSQPSG
jgi:ketosteroid isomerase-like protein